jgi:uncharacterized protein YcfJ
MYAKNFLNQIGDIKKKDSNMVLNDIQKGTIVGSTIGAGIGVFIAFGRGKNMLLGALIGSVIGGAISRAFIVKK